MNILLVYPKYPDTYWSFKHALKFISKKAAIAPLGLITVASLLPENWNKKLADLNTSKLKDKDLEWADYVFISAMSIQSESADEIIKQCLLHKVKIVAGGPLFTEEFNKYPEIDHLILNEAEITLKEFLNDLLNGTPKKIYRSDNFADITQSPLPDYSLLKIDDYVTAGIQYSRGCPFDCEFCDITALFGRHVRTKTTEQIIAELDQLYNIGWRGPVFFVDDNFIGNKKKLKSELLPAMGKWIESHKTPFEFITEASINMADDKVLLDLMVKAGFHKVFIGIETTEEKSLAECNKIQNNNRDLISNVRTIQKNGIEVFGGFIVGFDNDPPDIFQRQIDFIQKSGIITAMVGLLNAPTLSRLYDRLTKEGRIVDRFTGDNTDYSINFVPVMNKIALLKGYESIIRGIYSAKAFYARLLFFLKNYDPPSVRHTTLNRLNAFIKAIIYLGIFNRYPFYFWKVLFWCVFHKARLIPLAVTYSIYGYHFRRVFRKVI